MKKVLSLLVVIALICTSALTFVVSADVQASEMTLKAEVTSINSAGKPVITVTLSDPTWYCKYDSDGYHDDVLGAAAVSLNFAPNSEVFKLGSKTFTSVTKVDGAASDLSYNSTSKEVIIGWSTAAIEQIVYSSDFKWEFAFTAVDTTMTLEDYQQVDLGTFTNIFVVEGNCKYNWDTDAYDFTKTGRVIGTNADCTYTAGSVVTGPEATPEPTATPTAEPTATPTAEPTATPTAEPTATPTAEPTATPTAEPADKVTVDDIATVVAENTAYWGVKILEAAEANITAKFETDTESKEVTLVNAAGLDGNGDLAFNLYLKLTGERVGKKVTATVTVGEDSDSGVWAAAN